MAHVTAAPERPTTPTLNERKVQWRASLPFIGVQLLPLLAIWTGVTRTAVILFVVMYTTRVFFITAGYHRYLAHRSFRVGRVTQFVLAFGATASAQKGPLWWAANHRVHHRYTDTERDPHSPRDGFWWSHIGWVVSPLHKDVDYDTDIPEFARYPELRFLDKYDWLPPWMFGVAAFAIGGWSGLFFGFFGSTLLLWHATFMVNSVAHVFGRRRYDTPDLSRNNWFVAIMTFGEGWHNNHHHAPAAARQAHRWWEIDMTYYILRALAFVGVVHDLREPSERALTTRRL